MDKVDSVIKRYLDIEDSKSAVMITGVWGCGKTYYYQKRICQLIQDLGLIPLYISLNGINDVGELKRKILTKSLVTNSNSEEVEPNKNIIHRITEAVGKVIGTASKSNALWSAFDIYDFVNFTKFVICFDDLERISSDYRVEDLLGYINTEFVETRKIKVILIGDESKRQLTESNYHLAKEKLVSWTVEYHPFIPDVFETILQNYENKIRFHEFLKTNKLFILEILDDLNCKNIRTIEFLLFSLEQIYNSCEKWSNVIESDIIYFTLIISIEYKNGSLNSLISNNKIPDFIKGDIAIFPDYLFSLNDNEAIVDDNSIEKDNNILDLEKRFKSYQTSKGRDQNHNGIQYNFVQAIYDFITIGYLNESLLNKEFDELTNLWQQKQASNELSNISKLAFFINLSNEDFEKTLTDVFNEIKNKELDLIEFARGCSILLSINKTLPLPNVDNLNDMLLENIPDYISKDLNDRFYPYSLFDYVRKINEPLYHRLCKIYETIVLKKESERFEHEFIVWKNHIDVDNLFNYIIENIQPHEITKYILSEISDREFLEKLENKIEEFYRAHNIKAEFEDHKDPLQNIKAQLDLILEKNNLEYVDNYWLNKLRNRINQVIQKLSN
jgi:hypothetical protein